jgi:hypothetical protein
MIVGVNLITSPVVIFIVALNDVAVALMILALPTSGIFSGGAC